MEIEFRSYNGLAGDEHELLIAKFNTIKVSCLVNRMWFKGWSMWQAKRKLSKQIYEQVKLLPNVRV